MTDEKMMPCPVEVTDEMLAAAYKAVDYSIELGVLREGIEAALTAWNKRIQPEGGEAIAEIVSMHGDPEAFGERELIALVDIQKFPYRTKLYARAILSSDTGGDGATLEKTAVDTIEKAAEIIASLRVQISAAEAAANWRTMDSAPVDGTPFEAIHWYRNYVPGLPDPKGGKWGRINIFAYATDPRDEQCWHSIPRQSCIRRSDTEFDRWRPLNLPESLT